MSIIHPVSSTLVGFIAGMKKHYSGQTLMLDGKSWTTAALELFFQGCVDASTAAIDASVAKTAAVKRARDTVAQVRPVAVAFKKAVLAAYGADPTALADFELPPPRRGVKTPAVKQAAALKGAATRRALGTKGSKQKKEAKKLLASSAAQPEPAPLPAPVVPAKS